MRQYYEQDTDIVIVDTGDSYEGLCSYFEGTYISYSKEKPISMNPFKITKLEYDQNFGEKKNFLKSLIFQIFKGAEMPSKIEDTIINQTIVEYFEAYFNPFEGFTDEERQKMKDTLLLQDKTNGKYEEYEQELEEKYGEDFDFESATAEAKDGKDLTRQQRLKGKLQAVIDDAASTEGEKENAKKKLMLLTPEVIENNYLMRIERKLEKIERQKKKLKVKELSFNTYYEFALERIPQILHQQHIEFNINDFAAILKPFYKGGEQEYILNNDLDSSLFDEKFIVFEIDKVKDDPVLFPIIVLIIMDVFTQKMRIKKGRKCLVIEEAWKAIATPVMANYIKYLYKTARKHWAMVGVSDTGDTRYHLLPYREGSHHQQLRRGDACLTRASSASGSMKSRLFSDLPTWDCKKIFTINRLENKEGRSFFREVFIRRGTTSGVYGVEEPRECYMTTPPSGRRKKP